MIIKEWTQKAKDSKEFIAAIGSVIVLVIGGYFLLQDTLEDREERRIERELAIIERYSDLLSDELIEKIIKKIDPVSKTDFNSGLDSIVSNQLTIENASRLRDEYVLDRQDVIVLVTRKQASTDSMIGDDLDDMQDQLESLMGISALTYEQQQIFAERDSIRAKLMHLENQIKDELILQQMKTMRDQDLQRIEDAVKNDGKTKIIKVKKRKPKAKKEFRDRILLPL